MAHYYIHKKTINPSLAFSSNLKPLVLTLIYVFSNPKTKKKLFFHFWLQIPFVNWVEAYGEMLGR